MERDTMRYWIAEAAKAARSERGRGQVHVAAEIPVHQSTIWRFEEHKSFPDNIDLTVAAYANDLECDPLDIWQLAIEMWREAGDQANVGDLLARREPPVEGVEAVQKGRRRLAQDRQPAPQARAVKK